MRWPRLAPRLAARLPCLWALPLALACAWMGCGTRPRTQVMVEVHAGPEIADRLTRVHLRAQGFDATGLVPGMTIDRDVSSPIRFPIRSASCRRVRT